MTTSKSTRRRRIEEEEEKRDPFLDDPDEDEEEEEEERRPVRRKSAPKAKRRESRANKSGHIVLAWNDLTVEGNLGRDPEMSVLTDGTPFTRVSVAIWQGKDKDPCWMQVIFWRDVAEMVNDNFQKGDRIRVYGRLSQRSWEDRDGNNRITTEIVSDHAEKREWQGGKNARS